MERLRERWIDDAPGIDDLASLMKGKREGSETAIIILSSGDRGTLRKHIDALLEQDTKEFDLIIVYGEEDDFLEDVTAFNMIHVRERMPLGCAGAFYLGQLIALGEGYKYIILADDDALPGCKDMVSKHIERLRQGADMVLPKEASYGPVTKRGGIIHHYGGIRREVLESAGLTFLPFHNGGEDLELLDRFLQQGFRMARAETRLVHPPFRPIYLQSVPKLYNYQRGMIEHRLMRSGPIPSIRMIAYNLMIGLQLLIAGDDLRSRAVFSSVWGGSGFEFFRNDKIKAGMPEHAVPCQSDIVIDRRDNPGAGGAIGSLSMLPGCLNKKITLADSPRYKAVGDLLLALFASRTCASFGGRTYRVGAKRGPIRMMAGFVLLLLAVPLIPLAATLLTCRGFIIKKLSGIDSKGYGTRKKS